MDEREHRQRIMELERERADETIRADRAEQRLRAAEQKLRTETERANAAEERERDLDHHVKELESALETMEEERDEARAHAREGVKLLEGAMEREERLFAAGLGLADELREWMAEGQRRWDAAKELQLELDDANGKLRQLRATNAGLSQRLAVLSSLEVERTPSYGALHVVSVITAETT